MTSVRYDVVVPTIGRPSLERMLRALSASTGPAPDRVLVVDDRPDRARPLDVGEAARAVPLEVLIGPAAGPAAARNIGWRAATAPWIVFLDDDVVPTPGWRRDLEHDLGDAGANVVGSQGRIDVPLPDHRRPTDWERNVAGLASAQWATADMAYRRDALRRVGGFDERFSRAYREDADVALRVMSSGGRLVRGSRRIVHPVRPPRWSISVRLQIGNRDDVLMQRIHGRGWRQIAGAPPGRLRRHIATTAAAATAVAGATAAAPLLAAGGAAAWLALTADFAWTRIAPGPRNAGEIAAMMATSIAIPPVATWHHVAALVRTHPGRAAGRPAAVLFDRDGTLIRDVPYNGDPSKVEAMPGARAALERVRSAGLPIGVVSNQSGIARGLLTEHELQQVNARVEELLGPIDVWEVCPHDAGDGCGCRKPRPGLIVAAARRLGVDPRDCALLGDIGSDVDAARLAGARAILVPTPATRSEEVACSAEVAADLDEAVAMLFGSAP